MPNIIPLSSLMTAAQFPPTAANVPSLKHFFPCTESSGLTITDTVGNVTLGCASGAIVQNADGTISNAVSPTTQTGTFTAPGTKHVLIFYIGNIVGANGVLFRMGAITSSAVNGISIARGTGVASLANGSVLATGSTSVPAGASTLCGLATLFTLGANPGITTYHVNPTTAATGVVEYLGTINVANLSTVTNMTTIDSTAGVLAVTTATSMPSLASVHHFTTAPTASEIKTALAWMYNNTAVDSRHNKTVWPGFAGRT